MDDIAYRQAPRRVTCPICLSRIDWTELTPFRWNEATGRYVELTIPTDVSPEQHRRILRAVSWRCPNIGGEVETHFLPDAYGQHGTPVVCGFIGATNSGKTHLLAAMVGAIESGELNRYDLTVRPVDLARHKSFVSDSVEPLLNRSVALAFTEERVISFADAFLIGQHAGELRPVALFDVAGEELRSVDDTKRFLEIAAGLIFVIDPDQFEKGESGDPTFNVVLDLIKSSDRLDSVSAAVVVNKSDQLRFDDPVAMWLRRKDDGLDTEAVLQESADVYAYLYRRKAVAWARPFQECGNATLHFASATGGPKNEVNGAGFYRRGVRPQRVLAPLLSLLVMTGVVQPVAAMESSHSAGI